jgi:hypothetical protein
MAKTTASQNDMAMAYDRFQPGRTIYTNTAQVARSGMSRRLRAYIVQGEDIVDVSYLIARVLALPLNDTGLLMKGTGMDMGFALVYDLSCKLYGHDDRMGYALHQRWL